MKQAKGTTKPKCRTLPVGAAALVLGSLLLFSFAALAQTFPYRSIGNEPNSDTVEVALHKSRVVDLDRPVKRVSVGNPEIADILIMRSRQVYVLGKRLGSTNVILWDGQDRVVRSLDVAVTHDLGSLKQKLYRLLPGEDIGVFSSQGSVVLTGEVSTPGKMQAAMDIARSFARSASDQKDRLEDNVLNMMEVGGARQVMLEVQVAEVSRTLTRRLGVKFNAIDTGSGWKIGAVNGGATFPDAVFAGDGLDPNGVRIPVFNDGTPIGPAVDEFMPNDLSIQDKGIFASRLTGSFLFNAVIDAAKEENLAKILAEPTLTTMTGQEARFLSGGEFPIPVSGREGQINVEYKEFGIGLNFLPVVLDSGTINLKLNISVSELSSVNPVRVDVRQTNSGFFIPSLTKRSASSTVELAPGQTLGIAGLIDEKLRENINKFPGLGDIPILGLLFRSQEFVRGETELIIFVTPHFAQPVARETVRLPTDAFVEPSAIEFYLMGRMQGGKRPADRMERDLEKGGLEGRFGHTL